jgi:subtilisin-like proprotein convertase family protein
MNRSLVYLFLIGTFLAIIFPFANVQAQDIWEPNDTLAEARLLGVPPGFNGSDPGTYAIMEPDGTDWFRLPALSFAAKWVSVWVEGVTETYGSEDFDLRLELFRGDLGTSLTSSDNLGNGSFMPGLAGIPVITDVSAVFEITGFDPFDEGTYRVHTLTNLASSGGEVRDVMEVEPNDSAVTANVFADGVNISGRLDSVADEDWFQVDMGVNEDSDLLVAMRNDTGVDIKLEGYNPTGVVPLSGTVFDGRNGLDDFLVIPHGRHPNPVKLFKVTTTNGTGNYQLFFGFGVPNTVLCENASLTITDHDPLGIESTLNFPPEAIIGDLDVRVRLSHPDTGELTIELIHEDTGSLAILYQGACPGNTDLHLTFDDEFPFGISCPIGAGDRIVPATPSDALAYFDGENIHGDWTLRVIDNTPGNVGTLLSWCLELTEPRAELPICSATTDLNADSVTDAKDLLEAIRQFQGLGTLGSGSADLNCDGSLTEEDLFILQMAWKSMTP